MLKNYLIKISFFNDYKIYKNNFLSGNQVLYPVAQFIPH